jgi:ATP-dependent DNA helicase RecG
MHELTADELLQQLQLLDECPRIEAKKGLDIGSSVMQSVCAFANEPGLGGGYLLLGVSEPDDRHDQFYVSGVNNVDQLLGTLQTNCREQFEQSIPVSAEAVQLQGNTVIVVYVPELEPVGKPCTFKGKFDSKNKRKTGVWRRGLNGDYECTQAELEPLLLAKSGLGFEQVVLPDAEWDDLDPSVIELYRQLRARVRPHAEELQASDQEMLRALNLVKKQRGEWRPNVAGLLLMGKPLALRRLLPAVRVDYVRINGTQWVEDPEQRFQTTLDLREPLLRLIPKLEAAIADDLPKHFRLRDGDLQRSDQPLLPYKVIREAVVNAVMHRDYAVHQPTLVVRYSNRIEIGNAGYALKTDFSLGDTGSALRNPVLASVLYDLDFAETKGTGIRTMRRLLKQAGLELPVFKSQVIHNLFTSVYWLHQLLDEEHLFWLQRFDQYSLTGEAAKVLVLAKESGRIDALMTADITGLAIADASKLLLGLVHQGLLQQVPGVDCKGYQLAFADRPELATDRPELATDRPELVTDRPELVTDRPEFEQTYQRLEQQLAALSDRPRKESLFPIIVSLCALAPQSTQDLARRLKRDPSRIKKTYLKELMQQGWLAYRYPEAINHPEQAYQTTAKGVQWLKEQGIVLPQGDSNE